MKYNYYKYMDGIKLEKHKKNDNNLLFIIGGLALLLVIGGGAVLYQSRQSPQTPANQTAQTPQVNNQPVNTSLNFPQALVYGTWSENNSLVKAYDLSDHKNYLVAQLPLDIKKVTLQPANSLLYINNTDEFDHGTEIVSYSLNTKNATTLLAADTGFGIDDYVVSPNGKYIVDWEIKFAPGSTIAYGSKSRVYSIDISNPSVKNLIYDEIAETPVHYPRAVLDTGRIFTDEYYANTGGGWSYGMGVSDFTGSSKQEIPSMQNGTYGTQPVLSPDQTKLAFGGYDGSQGPGTELENGVRRALNRPNTVEVLDVNSLTRTKLSGFSNQNLYGSVTYDKSTGNLVVYQTGQDGKTSDIYLADSGTTSVQKIPSGTNKTFAFSLDNSTVLIGNTARDDSYLTNLGDTYSYPFTNFDTAALSGTQATPLPFADGFMQLIGSIPSQNLPKDLITDLTGKNDNLQMKTFALKQNLASRRIIQQNTNLFSILAYLYTNKPAVKGIQIAQVPTSGFQSPIDTISDTPTPSVAGGSQPGSGAPIIGGSGVSAGGVSIGIGGISLGNFINFFGINGGSLPAGFNPSNIQPIPSGTQVPNNLSVPTNLNIGSSFPVPSGGNNSSSPQNGGSGFAANPVSSNVSVPASVPSADSPLYLYGKKGQQVKVQINTPVFNALPEYNNEYNVTLGENGSMEINGGTYQEIKYGFLSAKPNIPTPSTGTIASLGQVASVLTGYAKNLGLNPKETNDLLQYAEEKITSPYVFISFYSQDESEQILPLSFTPKPDNYLNIIFYFKSLNSKPVFTPLPPSFPQPVSRDGLSAVEISEIVR